MSHPNHCGTEITDLSVMINRFSLENQQRRLYQHPANVVCSNFLYTNNQETPMEKVN